MDRETIKETPMNLKKHLDKAFLKDASRTFGVPYETPKDGLVVLSTGQKYSYSSYTRNFYELGTDNVIKAVGAKWLTPNTP